MHGVKNGFAIIFSNRLLYLVSNTAVSQHAEVVVRCHNTEVVLGNGMLYNDHGHECCLLGFIIINIYHWMIHKRPWYKCGCLSCNTCEIGALGRIRTRWCELRWSRGLIWLGCLGKYACSLMIQTMDLMSLRALRILLSNWGSLADIGQSSSYLRFAPQFWCAGGLYAPPGTDVGSGSWYSGRVIVANMAAWTVGSASSASCEKTATISEKRFSRSRISPWSRDV
jgi:hypothetical protein